MGKKSSENLHASKCKYMFLDYKDNSSEIKGIIQTRKLVERVAVV